MQRRNILCDSGTRPIRNKMGSGAWPGLDDEASGLCELVLAHEWCVMRRLEPYFNDKAFREWRVAWLMLQLWYKELAHYWDVDFSTQSLTSGNDRQTETKRRRKREIRVRGKKSLGLVAEWGRDGREVKVMEKGMRGRWGELKRTGWESKDVVRDWALLHGWK